MADTKRAMDRKFVPEPYDMDTMLGTNNSGVLMFSPYLEDTDTVSAVISGEGGSDAPVFNAQDSVLWNNLRDAFRDQITAMYRNLRAGNKWNAKYIVAYFEEMQSKWPEAMFNEDGRTKYLIPLIDPVTVDEDTGELIRTDRYLTMLQGSKAEQRKWWTYDRFRYTDSKYNTGDASKTINLRLFNGGTLTLTPAIDLYVGVSFGGGTTPALKRTKAEQPQTFEYVAPSGVTEMETWIYSADLIIDVGDLSVFYPNELDFSRATRLRRLKIGSDAAGYSNSNLTTINVSNNPLLEYIDCRNCPRLAESIEIEKSTRLKEAYFEGSGITGIELADGCTIETLHLPASITALTLMNLDKLTDLQLAGVSNVTRLMLSSMDPDVIDALAVVEQMPANSQIYIEGLDLELADAAAIDEFLDFLDTMKGVTRTRGANGDWIYHEEEKAQVSGKIHTDSLTGAEIAAFKKRYPYISVTADHVTAMINFKSYDGSVTYESKTLVDGADATYTGSTTPTRESTPQYNYAFANSWSLVPNGTSSANALKAVWEDRDVYACFNAVVRSYSVKYMNDGTQVGATQTVLYGGNATPPADPTHPTDSERYIFTGWVPDGKNITGNTTCIAQYKDTSLMTYQLMRNELTSIDNLLGQQITKVGELGLSYLTKLKSVDLPVATQIETQGFYYDRSLETLNAPNVTSISDEAFDGCSKLTSVSLPKLTETSNRAFSSCTLLTDVHAPGLARIGVETFRYCEKLKNINTSAIQNIGESAFQGCSLLSDVDLSNVLSIGVTAFYNCTSITELDCHNVQSIGKQAFYNCKNLSKFTVRSSTVPRLGTGVFTGTSTDLEINVPNELLDEFKSATNWSVYADRIKPISNS